jgi:hypothetical protein
VVTATISVVAGSEENSPTNDQYVVDKGKDRNLLKARARHHYADPLRLELSKFSIRSKFLKTLKVVVTAFIAQFR